MDTHEWRWWEEFEKTEPAGDGQRRNALVIRWVVTAGWAVLAIFKLLSGAWVFASAYAVVGVGFFVAYGIGSHRHRRRTGPDG